MLIKFSKTNIKKTIACLGLISLLSQFGVIFPSRLESANLIAVKDTLESSRLSFHGGNAAGLVAGSSIIKIKTSGFPSTSTANLFPGDTIKYIATATTYTVDQVIDGDEFSITTTLAAADADENDEFVVVRTATHTINLTTASAISNGAIRVKIKAGATTNNDTYPDRDGFDFNSMTNADVTCPTDTTGFDFVAGTATASGGLGCPAGYHCFECRYSGTGASSTALALTIGATQELVNPSPGTIHSVGTADVYTFIVENLDTSDNVIDSTSGKVAVIESVRVTATVEPTISFAISAVDTAEITSNDICGLSTDANNIEVSSTATSVPFGSLTLSKFTDAVQKLSCSTNGAGGYAVTVVEDDQLSIGGEGVTELADTTCDGGADTCNETTTAADWKTNNTSSGFGFSLHNLDASTVAFQWNSTDCSGAGYTGDINCSACAGGAGAYCAMKFPASADPETPLTLMKKATVPITTEDAYVCYRIAISTLQTAGDYENALTYRATATF